MSNPTHPSDYDSAVDHLRGRLTPAAVQEISAVFAFRFEDSTSATLDARPGGSGFLDTSPEDLGLRSDFEVTLSRADFVDLVRGRLHPMAGMATGRMRLKGSIKQAIKLDRILKA